MLQSKAVQISNISKRLGAHLPHWTKQGGIYSVTFRLADSIPQGKLNVWLFERKSILAYAKMQNRPLTKDDHERLTFLHSENIERYLQNGHGSSCLGKDDIASVVSSALKHFEGDRCRLYAWCIMPNHVHVIVQPLAGNELSKILQSWKSFTAKEVNKLLNRSGTFWAVEYYDHLIRTGEELERCIRYVWENPDKAVLPEWPWRWKAGEKDFPDQEYWQNFRGEE